MSFQSPIDARDRYRNLDDLVRLVVESGEDPLVVARSCGVSPSALVAALPRSYVARFVPNAESLSPGELMLRLASPHALDTTIEAILDPHEESRTRMVLARDILSRNSLVGQKTAPASSRITLSDESLKKLVELEQAFLNSPASPQEIAPQFRPFHKVSDNQADSTKLHDDLLHTPIGEDTLLESWSAPNKKQVRDLEFE